MKDQDKTREQLIEELAATRQRVAEMQGRLQRLEAAESERRRTEDALRQSEERLKRVLETLPVGVWITDEEGTITHGNPAGQQIWAGARYVGPERFGEYKGWWLDTGERIKPEEWGVARAIAKGEVSLEEEIEIECFDGSRKKILNWAVPILGPNQEIKGAVAVNQDITARVRVAEELRANMQQLRAILSHAPLVLSAVNLEGEFILAEGKGLEALGRKPVQLGVSAFDLYEKDHPEILEHIRRAMTGESVNAIVELGEVVFDVNYEPIRDDAGKVEGVAAVANIVTARVRADEALRQSRNELQALFDNMSNGFAYHKIVTDEVGVPVDYIFLDLNRAFERYTGLERERIIGKRVTEVHPGIEDLEFDWIGTYGKVALSGEPIQFEQYFEPQDHWYSIVAYAPVRGCFAVIFEDVTARKKAEEALRASEKQYRELIEALQEGIWSIDRDARTTFVNRPMAEMLGYTVDEMLGKHLFEFMDERGVEIATRNLERRQQGITEQHDFEFMRRDGARIYARIETTPITDEDGNYAGAIAGVMDITDRKRAAEELRRERDFANNLIETAPAIVLVLDTEGRIVSYNPYMEDISGYKLAEMQGKDWFSSFLPHHDHQRIRELFRQAVGNIQTRGNVNPIMTKQGRERQIEWYDKTLQDAAGNVIGLLSTGQDITERLRAEEELRQSEARWRSLTETSPDHILTLDTDFNIQFANFASPGLTVQDLIGAPLYTFVERERQAEVKAILRGVLRTGQDASYETVYGMPDGSTIHYESRVTPRRLPGSDEIIGLTLSARDVTARVWAEEQIKAALEEKEVLLRELYHRTKNNMQVISSMLALQAIRIQDEQVLSIFREVENRIQAMSLVHQKLYQSQDLSRIDIQEYIADLVKLLMQSYKVPLDKITLVVDIEHALVLIDTAIPCGLVLNELLSNVFKHAFPGDRAGEVKLCLQRTQDGTLALQVSDNGVGFPEGLDLRKSDTLGLQTVFGIAERQLRGKVAVETERGVTWRIKFKEDSYSPRV